MNTKLMLNLIGFLSYQEKRFSLDTPVISCNKEPGNFLVVTSTTEVVDNCVNENIGEIPVK